MSLSKARSRVGGYHFLGTVPYFRKPLEYQRTFINATFYIKESILKSVVEAAYKGEVAAVYANTRKLIPFRMILLELGHPQQQTPLEIDNTTAHGILTNILILKRFKAMDMRFYWLCDRYNQKNFCLYWAKGIKNLADYFTKHHPTIHYRKMRKLYLALCMIGKVDFSDKNLFQQLFNRIQGCLKVVVYDVTYKVYKTEIVRINLQPIDVTRPVKK